MEIADSVPRWEDAGEFVPGIIGDTEAGLLLVPTDFQFCPGVGLQAGDIVDASRSVQLQHVLCEVRHHRVDRIEPAVDETYLHPLRTLGHPQTQLEASVLPAGEIPHGSFHVVYQPRVGVTSHLKHFARQAVRVRNQRRAGTAIVRAMPANAAKVPCDTLQVLLHGPATEPESEIVLPVLKGDQVIAVLDVDSDKLAQFDEDDVAPLAKILSLLRPYL